MTIRCQTTRLSSTKSTTGNHAAPGRGRRENLSESNQNVAKAARVQAPMTTDTVKAAR